MPHIIIATDVDSPLCGPTGAALMYALQKGATPQMLPILERRNQEYGQYLEQTTGCAIIPVAPPHADTTTMMQPEIAHQNIVSAIKGNQILTSVFG